MPCGSVCLLVWRQSFSGPCCIVDERLSLGVVSPPVARGDRFGSDPEVSNSPESGRTNGPDGVESILASPPTQASSELRGGSIFAIMSMAAKAMLSVPKTIIGQRSTGS